MCSPLMYKVHVTTMQQPPDLVKVIVIVIVMVIIVIVIVIVIEKVIVIARGETVWIWGLRELMRTDRVGGELMRTDRFRESN